MHSKHLLRGVYYKTNATIAMQQPQIFKEHVAHLLQDLENIQVTCVLQGQVIKGELIASFCKGVQLCAKAQLHCTIQRAKQSSLNNAEGLYNLERAF